MEKANDSGNSDQNDSTDDFFSQLEAEVNGGIIDEDEQSDDMVTPETQMAPEPVQATQQKNSQGPNDTQDWEKRYKDSSREAQRMASELNELKPFVPVLDAMKQDSGLVDHVRNYFEEGGSPNASMSEKLGLDEDFVYDQHEAVTDPDSDSAKVFNAYVNQAVDQKVASVVTKEKQNNLAMAKEQDRQAEESSFRLKYDMTDDQFASFVDKARAHTLTLEDAFHVVNRDKVTEGVAKNTKKEMLSQMKNVRNIPTSMSNANSTEVEKSTEDNIFDALLGSDGGIDDLFG
ncbi:MAG: hypothetical protein H8E12_17430 [Rhodobacteraceae bacterium]|nr:hypothetical protein [Paracoccaceae bacterium]